MMMVSFHSLLHLFAFCPYEHTQMSLFTMMIYNFKYVFLRGIIVIFNSLLHRKFFASFSIFFFLFVAEPKILVFAIARRAGKDYGFSLPFTSLFHFIIRIS